MPRGRHLGKSEYAHTRAWDKPDFVPDRYKERSREEAVIRAVQAVCGRFSRGLPEEDDLASDVILRLWQNGGFAWDLDHIRAYTAASVRHAWAEYKARKTKNECDFTTDGEGFDILSRVGVTQPAQYLHMEALEAMALVRSLPAAQSEVLMILADGGSPIDVARDLSIDPWTAIQRIKEARANVRRVDPS